MCFLFCHWLTAVLGGTSDSPNLAKKGKAEAVSSDRDDIKILVPSIRNPNQYCVWFLGTYSTFGLGLLCL